MAWGVEVWSPKKRGTGCSAARSSFSLLGTPFKHQYSQCVWAVIRLYKPELQVIPSKTYLVSELMVGIRMIAWAHVISIK